MPVNASYPSPWIGHSQWRTLISLEGEVISRITDGDNANSGISLDAAWPDCQTGRVFHIYPIPRLEASVFFLAGRSFLINSPKGAFESLSALTPGPPSTIILLSWEDRYIDGLLEYCWAYSKLPQARKLEIYTSEWGWDAIKNRAWNQLISGERHQNSAPACQLFLNAIETAGQPAEKGAPIEILPHLFKKNSHYRLFPQIEWWLNYSLAPSPCLQAKFRLFDSYLTITHHNPYPSDFYQDQVLGRIVQRYPSAMRELQRVIGRRLADLIHFKAYEKPEGSSKFNLHPSFYTYNLFSKTLAYSSTQMEPAEKSPVSASILPKQLENNEFDLKTVAEDWKMPPGIPHLRSATAWSWRELEAWSVRQNTGRPAQSHRASRIFLAISCGGFSVISSGQITPITRVSIGRMNLSLLGFKLFEFFKDQNSPNPVFQKKLILLVSPWTEANVRREVAHLLWEFRNEFENVLQPEDILYLRQTVVPRCTSENGQLKYYEEGGFQFNPSGHFDFLRTLMDENEEVGRFFEPPGSVARKQAAPALIYHTTYKNLGRNIDEKVQLLADYINRDAAPAFLFELARHDSGKGIGSYWVKDSQAPEKKEWLSKPIYHKKNGFEYSPGRGEDDDPDNLFIEKPEASAYLLMSTASFLVNLDKLRQSKAKLQRLHFFSSYQLPLHSAAEASSASAAEHILRETLQFERDIDQITEQIPCAGVEVEADEQGVTRRFVPIKKEKDLYQNKIEVLEKIWAGERKKDTAFKKALPRHIPYLLEPDEKHDAWGGYRIRNAKELPSIDEKVSETWEASLHHKGVSGIKFDALNSVSLSTFLEDQDLDVMFKLLDCNSWLSIQLHPSEQACRAITRHWANIEKEFAAANWGPQEVKKIAGALNDREDNFGKEELFYIADNRNYTAGQPVNEANLILGLHQEKLEKLAFLSESEWVGYRQLFRKAVAPDDEELARLKEKTRRSAYGKLDTFVHHPSAVLSREYERRFSRLIGEKLPFILRLREEIEPTCLRSLGGILFILSLQALKESLQALKAETLKMAFSRSEWPLFGFFYKICPKPGSLLQVKPGVLHALGKGLFAVEASNRSNNTFRIFDHGRELSPSPRPLHYLLAAVSLSEESFVGRKNEGRYVFPYQDFAGTDNIRIKVFSAGELRKARTVTFPEEEGLLVLCTKGLLRITTAYKHLGTNIPNSTILDLKAAYTAYVPPADGQFERVVTVGASAFTEAECVVVCARALRRGRQPVDALGHTCARAAAERPQDACREFVQEYLDREKERNRLEEILGFYA
ncbi:MAG: hypothetical protein H6557_28535 [Lewinellaceae bacterium]|nr:hypothetical protein [Phaeodactylibacter sp.]MCB9040593.1 hypothetical protein [Lewinellaceae bacterium]